MSPTEIKILMEKYNIAPKKLFGQNFMISEGILNKIVASADLSKNDVILEVGPGLGALTFKLAPLVRQIIAVEKDRNLVKILRARLIEESINNVEVIEEDILKFKTTNYELLTTNYKLIANIPYYLTSVLIRKFLESENSPPHLACNRVKCGGRPSKMILMIQKEVAQRICLPLRSLGAGGRVKNVRRPTSHIKMNLLALSVQFYADAKILFYVSKNNFWPAPKVDSAVIEITPKEKLPDIAEKLFFKIARTGFSSKRKQLAGNLAQNLKLPVSCHPDSPTGEEGSHLSKEKIEKILQDIGLNPKTRAEDLKLEDWMKLIKKLF